MDSHAHLDAKEFDEDRVELIENLPNDGVEAVFTIGDDWESSQKAKDLADRFSHVYCTAGWHPHYADKFEPSMKDKIAQMLTQDKVCALGEIGLDYHYKFSSPANQLQVFESLLSLALELEKPFVIHNRESDEDLLKVIKKFGRREYRGVIHCFTSNADFAEACLELGFFISFSGILTFKKAEEIRQAAKLVPLEKLLIETDAPFLAPVPNRGKRNQPAWVKWVAETLSEIKQVELEHLAEVTTKNAYSFYGLN